MLHTKTIVYLVVDVLFGLEQRVCVRGLMVKGVLLVRASVHNPTYN